MRMLKIFCFAITAASVGSADDTKDSRPMEIVELAANVYLHVSHQFVEPWGWVGSNGAVLFDGDDAYIIDTPWSPADTKELVAWVEAKGGNVQGSLSTHSHDDRTAGIGVLNELGITTYVSELTNEFLAEEGKPTAEVTFPGPTFEWVPGKVSVYFPGGGHTRDNLVVWLHESKFLIGGCLVRSLGSNSLGYTGEATISTWADSIRNVKSKFPHAQMVVPGHGSVGDAQLLERTISLAESTSVPTADP